MTQKPSPPTRRLDEMAAAEATARLTEGRLIFPVGALEVRAPHLPIGTDLVLLDRLADDLAGRTGVPRAPLLPFGARSGSRRGPPGTAALSRKTLHRVMNELIAAWEEDAGVREVLVLTAHAAEAHLEALSAIRATGTVRVVDVVGLDVRSHLGRVDTPLPEGELEAGLLRFLRPDLVPPAEPGDQERGRQRYRLLLDRLTDLCFPPPGIPLGERVNLL